MPRAVELLKQRRKEDLWQMCCGFLNLSLEQFMAIQKRLLLEQIGLLSRSALGKKLLGGPRPETVEEFRRRVPITTYADYCPELSEQMEETLPVKPALWVHTSGRSGEYPCKWVPISQAYAQEMSVIMYGIGMLAGCKKWGDVSALPNYPNIIYTVAPRPYVSGAMAEMLGLQTSVNYMPSMRLAERLSFEGRVRLGFKQALSQGFGYFFGLSMVLVTVGDKFGRSSNKMDIRPLLSKPKALLRLAKGMARSKLARRPMLPRDLWRIRGIISSGLDSAVYRDRIKELWGRYPLDAYTCTEGGFIATQTWGGKDMTFFPSLNFLEFIPEEEHLKLKSDPGYRPKVLLLDEVQAGENYEIVITNFHGGALVRYRIGDMVKITSLGNEELGIDIPQMVFERRADDLIDFVVIRLTEKIIWQAIENAGIPYEDWTAYKEPGRPVLKLFIEPKGGSPLSEADVAVAVHKEIMKSDQDTYSTSRVHDDLADMINFKLDVTLLPQGTFARYLSERQAEGADLAHLKPPHVNPSKEVLALLLGMKEAAAPAAA